MTKKRRRGPCIVPLLSADHGQEAGCSKVVAECRVTVQARNVLVPDHGHSRLARILYHLSR